MIYVTKTFLPPQEEYNAILKRAWDKEWITNRGELVLELESKLKTHLGVNFITAMTNGTLPLQIAIKALELTGEIITTPFSYVATTSAIVWENCTPIFVDIDSDYLTIDETKIEAAITKNTSAILATHVFGNPCNVEAIEKIAQKYNLKVIYDAAHCFGVKYKGESIFNYGDVSTCSFHATKLFHCGEGGAIFSNSLKLHENLYFHHNFGHNGPGKFIGLGINAKMSELQAAMGLAVLPYIPKIIKKRKKIIERYQSEIKESQISFLKIREGTEWNYSYCPIIFKTEELLLKAIGNLNNKDIFPRRYFYPSLNNLNFGVEQECRKSEDISKRILCLPLSSDLNMDDVSLIIQTLKT